MRIEQVDRRISLSRVLLRGWREVMPAPGPSETLSMVYDEISVLSNLALNNPDRADAIVTLVEDWHAFAEKLRQH